MGLALSRALGEWQGHVIDDPAHHPTITRYLEAVLERRPYPARNAKGEPYQWCGAFVAFCLGDLHPELRRRLFPSTVRLFVFGMYSFDPNLWPLRRVLHPGGDLESIVKWHQRTGSLRLCQVLRGSGRLRWEPRPGDIGTVRPTHTRDGKRTPWGGHVLLVESFDPKSGIVRTFEGNAGGEGPRGRIRDGVVRNARAITQFEMLIRPSERDFDQDVRYVA